MKDICFINGSPRGKHSGSNYFISELSKLLKKDLECKVYTIAEIIKNKLIYEDIILYKKLVLVSPLYVDGLPSKLLEFMCDFDDFLSTKKDLNIKTYGIINCGFIEGEHASVALDILKNFSTKVNFPWQFGVGIGSGQFTSMTKFAPLKFWLYKPIYNALYNLKLSLEDKPLANINLFVHVRMYKKLFIMGAHVVWIIKAKKNNLKLKDLYE